MILQDAPCKVVRYGDISSISPLESISQYVPRSGANTYTSYRRYAHHTVRVRGWFHLYLHSSITAILVSRHFYNSETNV